MKRLFSLNFLVPLVKVSGRYFIPKKYYKRYKVFSNFLS